VPRLRSTALAALVLAACTPQLGTAPGTATSQVIVVPTVLPNGRAEIALRPSYSLGQPARMEIAVVATRGTITGPTEARVVASGVSEGGAPSEVLVRRLDVTAVVATADRRGSTSVTWNGEDQFGVRVPADAYVLLLEFVSKDGESERIIRATATLQMND
jgi:hypothetical protein